MAKPSDKLPFVKMHGLGNDFVVFDGRRDGLRLDSATARKIADRHTGVGCDQVIVVEPAQRAADAFMRIFNADGGEVAACGNAARCVAALLMDERQSGETVLETRSGLLAASRADKDRISVDMGEARLGWCDIPLARDCDTLHLPLSLGPLADPVGVGMGNPHAVFFVPDLGKVDIAALGPQLERDPLFPERANIGVAQVLSRDRLRLRVWERGAGLTLACGSGACAAAVAAFRRGLCGRAVRVDVDGGRLDIAYREDDHAVMTGPVAISFRGEIADEISGDGA